MSSGPWLHRPGHPLEMGPAAARNRSPPPSLVVAPLPPTGIRHPDAARWYTLVAMERTSEVRTYREIARALGYGGGSIPGMVVTELREQGRIGYRYKAYEQRVAA
jgi:hypothetical protein